MKTKKHSKLIKQLAAEYVEDPELQDVGTLTESVQAGIECQLWKRGASDEEIRELTNQQFIERELRELGYSIDGLSPPTDGPGELSDDEIRRRNPLAC